jgi:hypothetical protein
MRRFFNFLVTSNLYIAICASSLYCYYGIKMQENFFLSTVALVFSGTFLSYHIVRIGPWLRGKNCSPLFPKWYKKNRLFTFLSITLTILIAIFAITNLKKYQLLFMLFSFVVVLFYETIISTRLQLRRLPYTKPFIIALSWTLTCVGLHFDSFNSYFFLNAIDCFIFILLLCIPFDMKDREIDSKQGLKSFANQFEIKTLSCYLIILFAVYLALSTNMLSPRPVSLSIISIFLLYSWVQLMFFFKKQLSPLTTYLCIDGIIILKACFIF